MWALFRNMGYIHICTWSLFPSLSFLVHRPPHACTACTCTCTCNIFYPLISSPPPGTIYTMYYDAQRIMHCSTPIKRWWIERYMYMYNVVCIINIIYTVHDIVCIQCMYILCTARSLVICTYYIVYVYTLFTFLPLDACIQLYVCACMCIMCVYMYNVHVHVHGLYLEIWPKHNMYVT